MTGEPKPKIRAGLQGAMKMDYGDHELRVLTEIDDITKKRDRRRFSTGSEERTVIVDTEGHRPRWDFTIEHPMFGKLTSSYYPEDAREQLERYFGRGFGEVEDGILSIPAIPVWNCVDAGQQYLLEKIQQCIHDALCGLVMEAEVSGLSERNGHEFTIPDLNQKVRVDQIHSYYRNRTNKRLGTLQGQRKDTVEFLRRAYLAYCGAANELSLPVSDPFTRMTPIKRIPQEKLVEHMTRKRSLDGKETISVRGFTKQLKKHGFTYSQFVDRCETTRWEASRQAEP